MGISTRSKHNRILASALFASMCMLPSGGWAQQSGGVPAGGGASSADHGAAGHEGMDHGAMGHGGGMGGMMGQGGGMGGMMDHGGGMDHGASGAKSSHGGMMMGHMMCRTTEHVEGRLSYLKTELKLTDAQASQWNAFADAVRSATQKAGQFCASMHEHGGSAMSGMSGGVLAQLAMMERMMTAHLEEVRAVKAAAEPLFNVLSDEQKKTADQTMSGLMGFGMGMGGMGMMGGMGKM